MSWLDGIFGRRQVKLTDPASWHFDSGSWSGKAVTPDSVLQLATAWACIRLNAGTIASLPLQVFERVSDGSRRLASSHPLYAVLHDSPNAEQTSLEFWEGQLTAVNLRGDAFAEKVRNGAGQVIALQPLHPDLVTVYRSPVNYQFADAYIGERRYRFMGPNGVRDLGEADVFHLRGFGAGGLQGLSPIKYGRQTLGASLGADETAARTFANGLQLSGFVEDAPGARTTQEQREQIVQLFDKFAGSTRSGKVMPLPPGFTFKALGLSPEDAQLLETRGFHVEEICRWFGVMPVLIGHAAAGQTMWGSGVEQIILAWLTLSLRRELQRIEQAIEKQLLSPVDRTRFYVEHNVEGLLRADSVGRAALYASAGQNGWMDRNEIRTKENLPPRDGAGELTVQANLVPLAKLGQTPPRPTQPAPGDPIQA